MDATTGHRQRLKERFQNGEACNFPDDLLLEILLSYAIPQKDVSPLAKRLISDFGGLNAVLCASHEQLLKYQFVKDNTLTLFKLFTEIQNRIQKPIEKLSAVKEGPESPISPTDLFGEALSSPIEYARPTKESKVPMLFANAVLDDAIAILPELPLDSSLEAVRSYIRANLRFNSVESRDRYGSYITKRLFPSEKPDNAIIEFAKLFPNSQQVKDVIYYRFLKAEPLMVKIVHDLLLPEIGAGMMMRETLSKKLSVMFPAFKSIRKTTSAAIDALHFANIARSNTKLFNFGLRDICLPSFVFILLSEFPDKHMYSFEALQANKFIAAMFWKPDRIIQVLYELRNIGVLSKVSEIDNIRQFTPKYSIEEFIQALCNGDIKT